MTRIMNIYKGDGQCEITHQPTNSVITTDLPPDNGGKGRGFSPTDLFASSFASCVLTIMGKMAERKGDNLKGTTIEIDKIMTENPRRIGTFILYISFPADYNEEQKEFYMSAVKACPVHNSLSPAINIDIKVK